MNTLSNLSTAAVATAAAQRSTAFALAGAVLEAANEKLLELYAKANYEVVSSQRLYFTAGCVEVTEDGSGFTINKLFVNGEPLTAEQWSDTVDELVRVTEEFVLVSVPSLEAMTIVSQGLDLIEPARAFKN